MRNVKLLQTWGMYTKGQWVGVADNIAENLIDKGLACDPTRPKPEPQAPPPVKPKAVKKVAKKKAAKK